MVYLMTPQISKQKKSSKSKVFISLVILILLLLFAWLQERMNAEQVQEQPYLADLGKLWSWSEEIYTDGAQSGAWHLRWDATLSTGGMERLTETIFLDNKGKNIPKIVRHNGNIIEGEGTINGSNVIMSKVESNDNSDRVIVLLKLDPHSLTSYGQLKDTVEQFAMHIEAEDRYATISMKVIGESEQKDAMNYLLRLSLGQLIEQYEDQGTVSKTIFTPQINSYIWINQEKMANMQISIHEHSQTKEQSITLGIPLVSGEFGETS